jgi:seryl-tRNA(Sec) selenium transferase
MTTTTTSKILKELGFSNILNVGGHYTTIGGSLPSKKVLDAMDEAATYWVDIQRLEENAGKLLNKRIGCEDGMVTSGAYAANSIAAEVALRMWQQRDNDNLKDSEIVIQSSHVTKYSESFATSGIKVREITRQSQDDSLARHISKSTIALTYVLNESEFEFTLEEVVDAGKKFGLPVIVDAAVVDPPIRGIREVLNYRPDFVSVSGGKGLNGPNATGLLLGKREMISKARELVFPNYGPGRGMKVSKEEIAGLVMTVDLAVNKDEEAIIEEWKSKIEVIRSAVEGVPQIRTEVIFPWRLNFPQPIPRLVISIERNDGEEKAKQVRDALLAGSPSIFTRPLDQIRGPKNKLVIDARVLPKKDARRVGDRIRSELKRAF